MTTSQKNRIEFVIGHFVVVTMADMQWSKMYALILKKQCKNCRKASASIFLDGNILVLLNSQFPLVSRILLSKKIEALAFFNIKVGEIKVPSDIFLV